jgi:hypothetical protein
VISGYVVGNGLGAGAGYGITVKHLGTGSYELDFPPGTWDGVNAVIPVVTWCCGAAGGYPGDATLDGVSNPPDGSAVVNVVVTDLRTGLPIDGIFYFQVTQSLGFSGA